MRWLIIALVLTCSLVLYQILRPSQTRPPLAPPDASGNFRSPIDQATTQRLRLAVKDSSPQVRWAAAQFLHAIEDPEAVSILKKMMRNDPESFVRSNVLRVLAQKKDPNLIAPISELLKDTDDQVKLAAMEALALIDDPAWIPNTVTLIRKGLDDSNPNVRIKTIEILNRIQERNQRRPSLPAYHQPIPNPNESE